MEFSFCPCFHLFLCVVRGCCKVRAWKKEGLEAAPAKGIAQKEAMCSKKALCVDTFALCGYLCAMCL
jgi:hypothetical protein